jgi:hypothetical protein
LFRWKNDLRILNAFFQSCSSESAGTFPAVFFLKATWSFQALYAFLKRKAGYGLSLFLEHDTPYMSISLKSRALFSKVVSKSVVEERSYNISCSIPGKDEGNSRLNRFIKRRCLTDGIVNVQGYWNGLFLRSDRNNRA